MTTADFTISHAGPHVTVQDAGRSGLMRYGVPASGPMDRAAFRIANLALGNPENTPAIEVSLGGLTLHCTQGSISFAIAGGGFHVSLDQHDLPAWTVASIHAGQSLQLRAGPWGSWAYLAFAGQMNAHRWLGSTATHGPSGLGGGRLLTGAEILISEAELRQDRHQTIPCPVSSRPRHRIRVVLGPQDRFFAATTVQTFLTQPFTLTDAYDRMGVRLSGPALPPDGPLDMPSEPITRGSIQVAGDGVPTVLLADHQTTGGYPKIATILSGDLDGFAQLRPRNTVTFEAVSPQTAIAAARTRNRSHQTYLQRIGQDHKPAEAPDRYILD